MKANLPFKYITAVKSGKQYIVFDFKDDNGKRRRKWVSTGLPEKCTKKALSAITEEIVTKFCEEYYSGELTKATKAEEKEKTSSDKDTVTPISQGSAKKYQFTDFLDYWLDTITPTVAFNTIHGYRKTCQQNQELFQ